MTKKLLFKKGHRFKDPDSKQGYELVEDVHSGTRISATQFKPFGGAPRPESGKPVPKWLEEQIFAQT